MTTAPESTLQTNKDAALRFFDTLLDGDPTRLAQPRRLRHQAE